MSKKDKRKPNNKTQKSSEKAEGNKSLNVFYLFFGFIIVMLPLIHYTKTLDQVMMPRLFAINLFLGAITLIFFFKSKFLTDNISVLRQKIFPLFGLWFLISIVSMLFSINPIEGLYDLIKVFNTFSVILFATLILLQTNSWEVRLTQLFSASSIIMAGIGFWQFYSRVYLSDAILISDDPYLRPVIYLVDGLMAHKNLFSLALFLSLPFTLAGFFIAGKYMRWISLFASISLLVLIVLLQTRSVWLGVIIATAVLLSIMLFYSKVLQLKKIWRTIIISGFAIGIIGVVSLLYLSSTDSQNQYVKQFRSITDTTSEHNLHRINIWKSTISMIKDKPVIGYGPGNWKLQTSYYFDGRFFREDQLNWQRPHNDFLWVFAEKGIIGFFIYLGIFVFCYFCLFKVIISDAAKNKKIFSLLLMFGLTGYLASSFFDFPYERVYHQMILGVMISCCTALYYPFAKKQNLKINKYLILIPLFAFFVFGSIYGYKAITQEAEFKKARFYIRRQNWRGVLHHASLAHNPLKNLDPQSNPAYFYEGLAYVNLGDVDNGLQKYLLANKMHPGNIDILNDLGAALYHSGRYGEAKEVLEKSTSIFPSARGLTNLSAVYIEYNNYEKAYELLMKIPRGERTDNIRANIKAIEDLLNNRNEKNTQNDLEVKN